MANFYKKLDKHYIDANFDGILAVGDIHGNLSVWNDVVDYIKTNNYYLITLGDLNDYGEHSKEIFQSVLPLVQQNQMSGIIGNHENKLNRYFKQVDEGFVRLDIKPSLQASIDSFGGDKNSIDAFKMAFSTFSNILSYNDTLFFTHGAIQESFWSSTCYSKLNESYALFGEVKRQQNENHSDFPNRELFWIDKIPLNSTVFVGHHILANTPVQLGNAYFMDVGCSKEVDYAYGAIIKNCNVINYAKFC